MAKRLGMEAAICCRMKGEKSRVSAGWSAEGEGWGWGCGWGLTRQALVCAGYPGRRERCRRKRATGAAGRASLERPLALALRLRRSR